MKKIIIANWKMNPQTLRGAIKLAKASDKKNVVIAPPFVFTEEIGKMLKKAKLGAQDVFWKDSGAYTGEVSWRELKRLGVAYVIIGHSERRALGENDSVVNKKLRVVLTHGFKVILCVGEKWGVRKRGVAAAKHFVVSQLKKDLEGVVGSKLRVSGLMIAYEPVWAIGTGKNDVPESASEMAQFIKELLTTHYKLQTARVLYGGSVKVRNAKQFLGVRNIDGLLVGGASLKAEEFKKIINLVKPGK
jgi:triosephosphate isomerase